MPRRPRRTPPPPSTPSGASAGGRTTILVRRGALRRYDALKQKTADLPVVIDWDRRVGECREPPADAPAERRSGERRRTPPFTWEAADFVVIPSGAMTGEPEPPPPQPGQPPEATTTVGSDDDRD